MWLFLGEIEDARLAVFLRTVSHEVPLRIKLTRKLAIRLNGLDLSQVEVGDVLVLPLEQASMLIREGWAERLDS